MLGATGTAADVNIQEHEAATASVAGDAPRRRRSARARRARLESAVGARARAHTEDATPLVDSVKPRGHHTGRTHALTALTHSHASTPRLSLSLSCPPPLPLSHSLSLASERDDEPFGTFTTGGRATTHSVTSLDLEESALQIRGERRRRRAQEKGAEDVRGTLSPRELTSIDDCQTRRTPAKPASELATSDSS